MNEYSDISFRDPAGFVFRRDNQVYRQVNRLFAPEYEAFVRSGLSDELIGARLLLPHHPASLALAPGVDAAAVLAPEQLPFISYPHEWCFSQLRDAAVLTLDIATRALNHGFVLRDASAPNIQFRGSLPVLIDILSFAPIQQGQPWLAYRQFCQHFLAPLALMALVDPRLGAMHRTQTDGVPLDLAARLIGLRGWLRPGLLVHLFAQARASGSRRARQRDESVRLDPGTLPRLLEHLRLIVEGLPSPALPKHRVWLDYSTSCQYSPEARDAKRNALAGTLSRLRPRLVFDLGANVGDYSPLSDSLGATTVAIDSDCWATDVHFRKLRDARSQQVLPLIMDLLNPSGGEGWAHRERRSLADRGPADLVLLLGITHHLAISGGVPLPAIAEYLARLGHHALVEFVPPDDAMAVALRTRKRGYSHPIDRNAFESAFARRFTLMDRHSLPDTGRELYLYRRGANA